ncbi:hypothetical protein [Spirosoma areae]
MNRSARSSGHQVVYTFANVSRTEAVLATDAPFGRRSKITISEILDHYFSAMSLTRWQILVMKC